MPSPPIIEFAFPDLIRDSLIAAIESGVTTSTCSFMHDYDVSDDPLPSVGYKGAVVDSHGQRRFAVTTTGVDIVHLRDVPLAHALAEGEGYASVAEWRAEPLQFQSSAGIRADSA